MKRLANAKDSRRYSLAPLETLGMGLGSQLVTILGVNINAGAFPNGMTPNVHLERTRYLVLKNGALRVEGV